MWCSSNYSMILLSEYLGLAKANLAVRRHMFSGSFEQVSILSRHASFQSLHMEVTPRCQAM